MVNAQVRKQFILDKYEKMIYVMYQLHFIFVFGWIQVVMVEISNQKNIIAFLSVRQNKIRVFNVKAP